MKAHTANQIVCGRERKRQQQQRDTHRRVNLGGRGCGGIVATSNGHHRGLSPATLNRSEGVILMQPGEILGWSKNG